MDVHALMRDIPKTDLVLAEPALRDALRERPREQVVARVRSCLDDLRARLLSGERAEAPDAAAVAGRVARELEERGPYHLRRVINATGIVLHTNLGRAPLGDAVARHVAQVAAGYSNLEFDLERGRRGSRYDHVERLLCELTGAEAAMVVNNNAAAVFLVLDTLCRGTGVAISRGELVEIGGSFRVPEIMARSGAELVEVGTTNKTHARDYERALADGSARALLKVHTSNFVMRGFVESVGLGELARLARDAGARLIFDVGAAFLSPASVPAGIVAPTVRDALVEGADLVCFSGDKLLGSGQAGVMVGSRADVEAIRSNQLARMLRIDKLSLAALEASLQMQQAPGDAVRWVPALRMLSLSRGECREAAERLADKVRRAAPGATCEVVDVLDEAGGGSLPGLELPGAAVRVRVGAMGAQGLERALRTGSPTVVARIRDDAVLLSARTIDEAEEDRVAVAVARAAQTTGAGEGAGR